MKRRRIVALIVSGGNVIPRSNLCKYYSNKTFIQALLIRFLILFLIVGFSITTIEKQAYCADGKLYQGCFSQKAMFDNTQYTTDFGKGCETGWENYYGLILFNDGSFWYRAKQTVYYFIGGYPYPSITDVEGYGIYTITNSKVTGTTNDGTELFQLTTYEGSLMIGDADDFWLTSTPNDFMHYCSIDANFFPLLVFQRDGDF